MNAARSNTAIATTATAERDAPAGAAPAGAAPRAPILGRFAPSPTGPLHAGSLLAATGSYLQARSRGGRWLLRIEDVDTTRRRPEFEILILRALEAFGFEWDGEVLRQSERTAVYATALQRLQQRDEVFLCACSRRDINEANANASLGCVGHCSERQAQLHEQDCSLRWRVPAGSMVEFNDLWQGPQHALTPPGDVVLRRRDGLHTYQLAVIVDDAEQGITEVIRGADLLESTPGQILLQRSLGYAEPAYGHLPLLTEASGAKLAKSRHSAAIEPGLASGQLLNALRQLRQQPPLELAQAGVAEIWQWALAHWQPAALAGVAEICVDDGPARNAPAKP